MDFSIFIIVGVVFFVIYVTNMMDKKLASKYKNSEVKEKICPPHKWRYEDQPGLEDVSFIRCQLCKKTPQEVSEGK